MKDCKQSLYQCEEKEEQSSGIGKKCASLPTLYHGNLSYQFEHFRMKNPRPLKV